jgi:hypothetical protein
MKRTEAGSVKHPEPNEVLKKKQLYEVGVGNGAWVYFTRKRDADGFLAELNRFLTDTMYVMNRELAEVYGLFRRAWPYFDGRVQVERDVLTELRTAEDHLAGIPKKSKLSGGSTRVFSDLRGVSMKLKKVLEELEDLFRERSDFLTIYEMAHIRRRIDWTEREMSAFGYEDREDRLQDPTREKPKENRPASYKYSAHRDLQ